MSSVTLDGLVKRFGPVSALDGVSMEIADGELLTILGPSGCGKTTLLRVVAGLEQPTAGRVRIGERDVTDKPPQKRSIGMVFQNYALFPNLTVRQNICFPLEVRRVAKSVSDRRVDELLDIVHLRSEADRYPHQISGGQAQRCALARALAPEPDVLLLDEPLSALDVVVRVRLRDEIRRIQKDVGTTALYVTHDQGEALAVGDRVAVMNRGQIEQIGSPSDVYDRPATAFCASFVGNRNALLLPVVNGRVKISGVDAPVPAIEGAWAQVFVAPEDVAVVDDTADGDGASATIGARTFHGPVTRLHLECQVLDESLTIIAELPSRDARRYADGDRVRLRIRPESVIAFPADLDDQSPMNARNASVIGAKASSV